MNLFEYAELLMTTDKKQCFNKIFDNGSCCAMGLPLLESESKGLQDIKNTVLMTYAFKKATGLSIARVNDIERWSFARIGEYLLCSLLPG